ncbi:MAG: hypothetical protein ACXVH7_02725, partial [Thermoanaerobaculia bacterium]
PIACCYAIGQLVLYDTKGESEPRVIYPTDGVSTAGFTTIAVRESGGVPTILIQTSTSTNLGSEPLWMLTTDGGLTWKKVGLPTAYVFQLQSGQIDVGGPFARGRYSQVRIGNEAYPFVVSVGNGLGVYAVAANGDTKVLVPAPVMASGLFLAGSNLPGTLFLVRIGDSLYSVDLNGMMNAIATLTPGSQSEGWITPRGDVYVDEQTYQGTTLTLFSNGTKQLIATGTAPSDVLGGMFAIPTFDYDGAWIITRGGSAPTVLYRHQPGSALQTQWEDITAPEVEALHAGATGNSLLIQVHRQRPQADQRIFKDPALAIWRIGQPAPRAYDELFMNEQTSKAFVHLDVEAAERGEVFVFDSGSQIALPVGGPVPMPSPGGGGSDVIQEWGVVRASLKQRLVLPSIGRTPGAFGSYWMSDVIVYNPLSEEQPVTLRFVPGGENPQIQVVHEETLTLKAREIRVIPDVLKTLFNTEVGNGALFVTPTAAVSVTSRTYTRSDKGTFGFGMNGIDVFTAANARFPVTFAGAFHGPDFRTNLVLTDVSGRGAQAQATAISMNGTISNGNHAVFAAPANGQQQYNNMGERLTISQAETGALVLQPSKGDVIASVMVIDNRTNDPTYFPPDLPSSIVRTIPAIGHLDGANGSKFRTDLFVFNPYNEPRSVTLQVKAWDSFDMTTLNLTLLPNESRVLRDVLFRAFSRTGIARLRFLSAWDSSGVRITARTYTIDENGGTYGYLMPALNSFQSAAPGDSLEILGVLGGERFRTNIGLVELSGLPTSESASARVELINEKGEAIDSFTVNVPIAGGTQLNDVFRARGLGVGPVAALIRVTPLSGMFAAYATMIDNGTNDPVYLAANLAAHE